MNLSARWQKINEQVNQRSLRERVMLFTTLLAIVYFLVSMLLTPLLDRARKEQEQALTVKQAQMLAYRQETKKIKGRYLAKTDEAYQQRLDELVRQINSVDSSLTNLTESLVGPTAMAGLVREILSGQHNLELVQLKNLPPRPLFSGDEQQTKPAAEDSHTVGTAGLIYKHGMLIELTGRFNDIIGFLDELEHSRHKMLWQEITLRSEQAPLTTVSLLVYTLSLEPAWMGV